MILREVAGADFVSEVHGSDVGVELGHDDLEECRLAESVGPDDRDFLPATHGERHVGEDLLRAVGLRYRRHLEHIPPARAFGRESEERRAA